MAGTGSTRLGLKVFYLWVILHNMEIILARVSLSLLLSVIELCQTIFDWTRFGQIKDVAKLHLCYKRAGLVHRQVYNKGGSFPFLALD